ncbi:MAG TPA: protein phosphatase 2C domain-containing protein [Vicinamibacterales bacterium]|nr:protein phosphatase 2C domain-containing protein [Vicinamibacterales bacterium]
MLTVCSRTHPGTVRTINEDSSLLEPDLGVVAVADGMGGHNAGEVASQLALDTIRSFLKKSASGDDITWPFGFTPTRSFAANRLMTAIRIANRRVFRASEERTEYTGMGTTVVAAVVEGARLAYSGVGDSRIYSFDGRELRQITKDDSWVEMLKKESGLDASAFEKHPMRHVLTSVVGARPELDVTVDELDLVDGQTIMLCTDGLHGALKDRDVAAVLRSEADLDRAAAQLVEMAVQRDGKDNVTVAFARYGRGH